MRWDRQSSLFSFTTGVPITPSLPAPPAPQLHTIDCQVHPGAVGKILFRAVLVQEEHTALVPALVFHPEPVNLERCACLQSDSSCEEGSPKSRVVKERTLQGPPPASRSWSLRPFPEVENSRGTNMGLRSLRADCYV